MIDPNSRVEDLMTSAVITARVEDTMDLADLDMKLAGIRHIPVVDEQNRVVGVVSDRDILRSFGALGTDKLIIGAIMSTDVQTIGPDAPARDALARMLENKFSCLPVVDDDGGLIGVITETDFMRLLHDEMVERAGGRAAG